MNEIMYVVLGALAAFGLKYIDSGRLNETFTWLRYQFRTVKVLHLAGDKRVIAYMDGRWLDIVPQKKRLLFWVDVSYERHSFESAEALVEHVTEICKEKGKKAPRTPEAQMQILAAQTMDNAFDTTMTDSLKPYL